MQSSIRFRLIDLIVLMFLFALHLALRRITIQTENEVFVSYSAMLVGPLLASYLAIKGLDNFSIIASVFVATVFAVAWWPFECFARTEATQFLWNDFRFENYSTDLALVVLVILVYSIPMTAVSVIVGAIVRFWSE